MSRRFLILSLFCLALVGFSGLDSADAASIKDRMAARIPAINGLKDASTVGENKAGFLEFRSGDKSQAKLVQAENADRKAVYGAIAKKQGATAALVGQRRAKMIADKGKKGHQFQSADGKWYTK